MVAAELDELGIIRRRTEAYGSLPRHGQNVHAAELFALLFYLQHAVSCEGMYEFFSDCAYVVEQFREGRYANTHGWAIDAGLWVSVFDKAEDLGLEFIKVHKVQAHRKLEHAENAYDRMQIQANSRADALAKFGVELHPDNKDFRKTCVADARKLSHILKFMAKCLAYSIDNRLYQDIQGQQFAVISRSTNHFDPEALACKHFFTHMFGEHRKARCVKCFSPCVGVSRNGKCPGDAWAKGHLLMSLGCDLVFCRCCGAYSVGRVSHLYNVCTKAPWSSTSKKAKTRLLGGMHPVTGTALGIPVPLIRYFKPEIGDTTAALTN